MASRRHKVRGKSGKWHCSSPRCVYRGTSASASASQSATPVSTVGADSPPWHHHVVDGNITEWWTLGTQPSLLIFGHQQRLAQPGSYLDSCWACLQGLEGWARLLLMLGCALGAVIGRRRCLSLEPSLALSPALPASGSWAPRGMLAAAEVSCAGKHPPRVAMRQVVGLGEVLPHRQTLTLAGWGVLGKHSSCWGPGGSPSWGTWAFLPPLPSLGQRMTMASLHFAAWHLLLWWQWGAVAPCPQLSPSCCNKQIWLQTQSGADPSAAMLKML